METLTLKLYDRLKEKLGAEDATLLIEFIDVKVRGEVATKEDIAKLDKRITDEVAKLDKRITDLEWKLKLYFILLAVLIIFTNPNALDLLGRVLGLIK